MSTETLLNDLFATLDGRAMPEDIATMIKDCSAVASTVLKMAARHGGRASSMSTSFWRPKGIGRQLASARALFPRFKLPEPDATPADIHACVLKPAVKHLRASASGSAQVSMDFKADRLNRAARRVAGIGEMSRRQYNKKFRFLARLQRKADKLRREWTKSALAQTAKSRLACKILKEDFTKDLASACFIAYVTAGLNRRSTFTVGSQASAYDEVAKSLMAAVKKSRMPNWFAIAHVWPDAEVIRNLTFDEKGRLLGMWHGALVQAGTILRETQQTGGINRETMIVKCGNDSSTWNGAAGAWNKCRDGYLACLEALGMSHLFDLQAIGKVPRLIAGDVACWHRSAGDDWMHPDVKIWSSLPSPWEVLDGTAACRREDVEAACGRFGVDPEKTGWTSSRKTADRHAEAFAPTPELVHGVSVTSPALAAALRKAGWFSGKRIRDHGVEAEVMRSEDGFALSARPSNAAKEQREIKRNS